MSRLAHWVLDRTPNEVGDLVVGLVCASLLLGGIVGYVVEAVS